MSNTLIDKINEEKKEQIDIDSFIFDMDNLSKHILECPGGEAGTW